VTDPTRSYAGVPAADRVAARRERLLQATIQLIATDGAARTTMTRICSEAGLTERYFYESFGSRDDALLAALNAACERIADTTLAAVTQSRGAPADRVRAALSALVDLMVNEPGLIRVAVAEATVTPALRARRRELLSWFADLCATTAADLLGDDAGPAEHARMRGLAFAAGLAELLVAWQAGEFDVTPAELVDITSDLFLSTCAQPAGSAPGLGPAPGAGPGSP
jgi:AcrR family transcriptional regulator